jgi:predicted DNA-binding transcriptional regulator AlpA
VGDDHGRVGRKVDLDDIIDAAGVGDLLGLAHRNSVYVYRSRYPDFPNPVLEHGRCLMWLRSDIEKWMRHRAGRQNR